MKRYLTGIKPTGIAHLGNYFGAIKPAIEFSKRDDAESFYFIADYHALNVLETREEMIEYTYGIACTWLACGLDPSRVVFYKQSDVPEVFELNWILSNVTPKGLMNRAHAYKAVVERNEANGVKVDDGVNMGLYNYPILMSADILLIDADGVPVGLDQKQHVEMCRDIAQAFNRKYGKTLKEPEEIIDEKFATLVGLDGRKMSKSYNNTIQLFCDEKTLQKTINRIVTDSSLPEDPKPLDCTINKLYKLFASIDEQKAMDERLTQGIGWGEAKKELFRVMNNYLSPMREKYNYYNTHRELVDEILREGAKKVRVIAGKTMERVRNSIGAVNI